MTQPIDHGYPDYGRFAAHSDVLLTSFIEDTLTAQKTYGPFFCGGLTNVALKGSPDAARAEYSLLWYNDNAGTILLGSDVMILRSASSSTLTFPVRGPWLQIQVNFSAYPNVHGMTAYTVPQTSANTGTDGIGNWFLRQGLVAVGAASTSTINATTTYGGEAHMFSYCGATSGNILVSTTDLAGAATGWFYTSDRAAGEAIINHRTIHVPPVPIQALFTNNDAVPRLFSLQLMGRPLHAGR